MSVLCETFMQLEDNIEEDRLKSITVHKNNEHMMQINNPLKRYNGYLESQ